MDLSVDHWFLLISAQVDVRFVQVGLVEGSRAQLRPEATALV